MSRAYFNEFLASGDTLRVYRADKLIFASSREGVSSLLEYAGRFTTGEPGVTVFDQVVGNAAALLLSKIACREVYSPLGSRLAAETLLRFGIGYRFTKTVPYIKNRGRNGICPMEELSQGKNPEEFFRACHALGSGQAI